MGTTTYHDHVLGFEGLRRLGLVCVLAEADDIEALVRRAYAIAEVVPDQRGEVVTVELLRAKGFLPAGDRLVVDVELVLVVEARRDAEDVILRGAPAECFGECSLVALDERLVGEEVTGQLACRVQGFVGAESCASEWVFVFLRVDLFEAIVAKNRVA
jgi:hypothetical protein